MLGRMDARERFMATNTLNVLLMGSLHQQIQVEMKNTSIVSGELKQCDGYGNMTLHNAIFTTITGTKTKFDKCFVKASQVRYVHMSGDVEPEKVIRKQFGRIKYFYRCRDEAKSARMEKTKDPLEFDYQEDFRYSTEEEDDDDSSVLTPEKPSCSGS